MDSPTKDIHQAFVDLYGLLERTWVPRFPKTEQGEQCLMTGAGMVVSGGRSCLVSGEQEIALLCAMDRLLSEVTGVPSSLLHRWSDEGPKAKVLAGVAECIARTAPLPYDVLGEKTPLADEVAA